MRRSKFTARASALLISAVLVLPILNFSSGVANAATCPSMPWVSATNGVPEPLYKYKEKLTGSGWTTFCQSAATNWYWDKVKQLQLTNNTKVSNDFSKRISSCMGNTNLSLFNIGSWTLSLKCVFIASFVPTQEGFKTQFNNLTSAINTHQPSSYVPVAFKTFNGIVTNWGKVNCSTSALAWNIRFTGLPANTVIAIPCSPPAPLLLLRKFLVISVWLMFVFFIYSNAINFLKER